MAREIHDTLGHYLTVIHVQLEAARAVIGPDADRGMLAVTRAQALAKDGLAAVRQSVKALREDGQRRGRRRTDRVARRLGARRALQRHVQTIRARRGRSAPRSRSRCIARRSKRSPTSASTPTPRTSRSSCFPDNGRVQLRVHDDGKGAADETVGTGFGLKGIRERAEQLEGQRELPHGAQ